MPRAHRHFLPGLVWHVTQRCHRRSFLLKFAKDRKRWVRWLHEAKRRYGLQVLNYQVLSNHVHLLVRDTGDGAISPSLQLVAGRTAQEYNSRKGRQGAFWQDRYHATAVESGSHLLACMTYIDLNVVRAGIVCHPSEWPDSSYYELANGPRRRGVTSHCALVELLGIGSLQELQEARDARIQEALSSNDLARDHRWTEGVAVGSREFVESVQARLGKHNRSDSIEQFAGGWCLRESAPAYATPISHPNLAG